MKGRPSGRPFSVDNIINRAKVWYPSGMTKPDTRTQREKFEEAARELECDEDEARWDERLKKVARQKPAEKAPSED